MRLLPIALASLALAPLLAHADEPPAAGQASPGGAPSSDASSASGAGSQTAKAPASPAPAHTAAPPSTATTSATTSATPTADTCACESKPRSDYEAWSERGGVTGLRVSALRVRGSDADASTWGLAFAGNSEDYRTRDGVSRHGRVAWVLGGGSGGFEGYLGGQVTGGTRLDVAVDQGPVLRVGFQGWLGGNGKYYTSLIELPVLQLGWQFSRNHTLIEVGVQGGPVLAGRYSTGDDARRKLGGEWESTGYLALHFDHARLDFGATRFVGKSGDGTAIDTVRANLCAMFRPIGVCADVTTWRGAELFPDGTFHEARSLYGGITIGTAER